MNPRKETELRFLIAALALISFNAQALVVDLNSDTMRSREVSGTFTVFKVRPDKPVVVEVSGTGAGILKASTDYASAPTTFNGFTPDPDGSVSGNTAWQLPMGLAYVGFDRSSGTWTVRVSQPK